MILFYCFRFEMPCLHRMLTDMLHLVIEVRERPPVPRSLTSMHLVVYREPRTTFTAVNLNVDAVKVKLSHAGREHAQSMRKHRLSIFVRETRT